MNVRYMKHSASVETLVIRRPRPLGEHPVCSGLMAADSVMLDLVCEAVENGLDVLSVRHDGEDYEIVTRDAVGCVVAWWVERNPHLMRSRIEKSLRSALLLCRGLLG